MKIKEWGGRSGYLTEVRDSTTAESPQWKATRRAISAISRACSSGCLSCERRAQWGQRIRLLNRRGQRIRLLNRRGQRIRLLNRPVVRIKPSSSPLHVSNPNEWRKHGGGANRVDPPRRELRHRGVPAPSPAAART